MSNRTQHSSHKKTIFHLIVFLALLFCVVNSLNVQEYGEEEERSVLLKLKQEFGIGPSFLKSWSSNGSHYCRWEGIRCDIHGFVYRISFGRMNITEKVPSFICDLKNLTEVDISSNHISGEFPISILNCSKLRYLNFNGNQFVGKVPIDIDRLWNLRYLDLGWNNFSGDIPESIGNMSSLESLDLSSNRLSGRIPRSLATIDSLEVLNLSYNMLSGEIPRETHFDTLSLDGLAFTGNDLLCGYPTEKICQGDRNTSDRDANPTTEVSEEDDAAEEKLSLYASVALGFVVGFLGLFCVLLLKKEDWWNPYWRFVESVAVRITSYIF